MYLSSLAHRVWGAKPVGCQGDIEVVVHFKRPQV